MGERHAGRRGGREEGRVPGRETKKKHGSACSGLVMLKATKAKVRLLNGSQAIVWMILRTLAKWMCQRDVSGAWSWMVLTSSWTQGTDSYAPFCGLQRVCAHLFIHVLVRTEDTAPTAMPLLQSFFGSPPRRCKTFSPAGFLVWIPNNHMKNSVPLSQARWATGRLNSGRYVSGRSPQNHGYQDFQSLCEIS